MMYADNPRRSAPEPTAWFYVRTPQGLTGFELPTCNSDMNRHEWAQYRKLEALADAYGTPILSAAYRLG